MAGDEDAIESKEVKTSTNISISQVELSPHIPHLSLYLMIKKISTNTLDHHEERSRRYSVAIVCSRV